MYISDATHLRLFKLGSREFLVSSFKKEYYIQTLREKSLSYLMSLIHREDSSAQLAQSRLGGITSVDLCTTSALSKHIVAIACRGHSQSTYVDNV